MNINIEIFKRNIKLQELGIGELSGIEKQLFNILNIEFSNLVEYNNSENNMLSFGKSIDNILFEYYTESKNIWINRDRFEHIYEILNDDGKAEEIIEWWISENLGLELVRIFWKTWLNIEISKIIKNR